MEKKEKKPFQLPHVILILMIIMVVVTIMSFFIPSGQFVREANGVVDPSQFSYVENENPITLFDFFYAIPHGIVESASIIISIMVISGVLYVIEQTGAIAAGLQRLNSVSKGRELVIVLGLMFVFGILGVIGWGEDALPFIPMVVSLALALGYDRMVGVAIVHVGICIGFTSGAFNIFTTGVCQELAGISLFSAWQFRLVEFLAYFVVSALFVAAYCKRIKRDPSKSVIPGYRDGTDRAQGMMDVKVPMTVRRVLTLLTLLVAPDHPGCGRGAVWLGYGRHQRHVYHCGGRCGHYQRPKPQQGVYGLHQGYYYGYVCRNRHRRGPRVLSADGAGPDCGHDHPLPGCHV